MEGAMRLKPDDTLPLLPPNRLEIGYDFAQRVEGWQLVLVCSTTMGCTAMRYRTAFIHAQNCGLRLDEHGFILR